VKKPTRIESHISSLSRGKNPNLVFSLRLPASINTYCTPNLAFEFISCGETEQITPKSGSTYQ
jgi:hypothetical protein